MPETSPSRHRFITILLVLALFTGGLLWWLGREEPQEPQVVMAAAVKYSPAPKKESSPVRQGDGTPENQAKAVEPRAAAENVIHAQYEEERRVLSSSGRITTAAMEELGLSEDQAETLRKITKKVMSEAEADSAARVKVIQGPNEAGEASYHLPAREDGGKAYVDQLAREFEAAVGRERALPLIEGLKQLRHAGGMGRYEIKLAVNAAGYVDYECTDTSTGQGLEKGQSSPAYFQEKFGRIIELPEKSLPEMARPR